MGKTRSRKFPPLKPKSQVERTFSPKKSDSAADKFPIWTFRNVDRDGKFAFNPNREDFDAEDFINKMLAYSNMTWQEIEKQTHDDGKSKHHFLSNADKLSKDALARIEKKNLVDDVDSLFSFALNNTTRIIGIRKGAIFQVVWYDANHEFAPSEKKHT